MGEGTGWFHHGEGCCAVEVDLVGQIFRRNDADEGEECEEEEEVTTGEEV